MNEIDKVTKSIGNFKNAVNDVKNRTLNDYDNAKSDAESERENRNSCKEINK